MRGQDDDRVRAWQLVADGDSRWGVVQRITAPVDEHSLEEAFIVVVDGKAFKIARCERNLVGLAHTTAGMGMLLLKASFWHLRTLVMGVSQIALVVGLPQMLVLASVGAVTYSKTRTTKVLSRCDVTCRLSRASYGVARSSASPVVLAVSERLPEASVAPMLPCRSGSDSQGGTEDSLTAHPARTTFVPPMGIVSSSVRSALVDSVLERRITPPGSAWTLRSGSMGTRGVTCVARGSQSSHV